MSIVEQAMAIMDEAYAGSSNNMRMRQMYARCDRVSPQRKQFKLKPIAYLCGAVCQHWNKFNQVGDKIA